MNIMYHIINGIAEDFQKDFPEYTVKAAIATLNLVVKSKNPVDDKWHTFLFDISFARPTQYIIYHHNGTPLVSKPFEFDVAAPGSLEALYDWIKMKCEVE